MQVFEHLSMLETREEPTRIDDRSLNISQLFAVKMVDDYYEDIVHLLTMVNAPKGFSISQKKLLVIKAT